MQWLEGAPLLPRLIRPYSVWVWSALHWTVAHAGNWLLVSEEVAIWQKYPRDSMVGFWGGEEKWNRQEWDLGRKDVGGRGGKEGGGLEGIWERGREKKWKGKDRVEELMVATFVLQASSAWKRLAWRHLGWLSRWETSISTTARWRTSGARSTRARRPCASGSTTTGRSARPTNTASPTTRPTATTRWWFSTFDRFVSLRFDGGATCGTVRLRSVLVKKNVEISVNTIEKSLLYTRRQRRLSHDLQMSEAEKWLFRSAFDCSAAYTSGLNPIPPALTKLRPFRAV